MRLPLLLPLALLAAAGCRRAPTDDAASAPPAPGGEPIEVISTVERQPFVSAAGRLLEALRYVGSPLPEKDQSAIEAAMNLESDSACVEAIQKVLNEHCLIDVHINSEGRVKLARGPARAELMQGGWRAFLFRVHNEPGVTAPIEASSENSQPTHYTNKANMLTPEEVARRWMQISTFDSQPMNPALSGLPVEYRILQIYSRDAGRREGHISLSTGQGSQDVGFRNDLHILFVAKPSAEVTLRVRDVDGKGVTASFVFQDEQGRVYPYSAKREAPDFFFHDQVYRSDGETILLPPGKYNVAYSRGPEYRVKTDTIEVPEARSHEHEFKLERWIDPNADGWFSGDHHIHAAGCLHYKSPALGVEPEIMMKHVLGEALNVGCVLTWGPGWYHQKNNFTGQTHPLSTDRFIIRYDVEVSGFPSDHTGHICLLGLSEDDFPGTEEKQEWPTWGLPILKWAKEQGGVVGVAHSGWGLDVSPEARIPNYKIPPMDQIGAQEYIVDVAHGAMDFISTVDTPHVWELNIWYHTLNCGFEPKISGETDFPCIYGDRVGLGRSYVKLDGGKVTFEKWLAGLKAGRSYVSDGFSHLMDFTVNGVAPGGAEASRVELEAPGKVRVRARVAALLAEAPEEIVPRGGSSMQIAENRAGRAERIKIRDLPYTDKPYWHVERARVGDTRMVPVEVVVNGLPVAREEILADGAVRPVEFEIPIERSSWVALRVLASSHTNPVTVRVDGQPVMASKLSAQWCLDSIAKVWVQKARAIRRSERAEAHAAFDEAVRTYAQLLAGAYDDRASIPPEDLKAMDDARNALAAKVAETAEWERQDAAAAERERQRR